MYICKRLNNKVMTEYKTHFAHKSIFDVMEKQGIELKNTVGTPKCGSLNSSYQNITFDKNQVTCVKCLFKLLVKN